MTLAVAIGALRSLRSAADHCFWADDVSLCDASTFAPTRALGHRQLADAYLLALAVHRRGQLVTFDRGIPLVAVPGSTAEHVLVLRA